MSDLPSVKASSFNLASITATGLLWLLKFIHSIHIDAIMMIRIDYKAKQLEAYFGAEALTPRFRSCTLNSAFALTSIGLKPTALWNRMLISPIRFTKRML
jgi:hypothetical protein